MLTGPVFYRRLVSSGAVDRAFAQQIVDRVLAAYANDPTPQDTLRPGKEPPRACSDWYLCRIKTRRAAWYDATSPMVVSRGSAKHLVGDYEAHVADVVVVGRVLVG